jgi:hypothetical protein
LVFGFGQAIFMMLILLVGPDLGEGGTALDGMAQPEPAFVFFTASFFVTLAFRFLIAAYEASELGRERGVYDTTICSRTWFKRPPLRIHLARYIFLNSTMAPNSCSCLNEGNIIGVIVRAFYFKVDSII